MRFRRLNFNLLSFERLSSWKKERQVNIKYKKLGEKITSKAS